MEDDWDLLKPADDPAIPLPASPTTNTSQAVASVSVTTDDVVGAPVGVAGALSTGASTLSFVNRLSLHPPAQSLVSILSKEVGGDGQLVDIAFSPAPPLSSSMVNTQATSTVNASDTIAVEVQLPLGQFAALQQQVS